MRTGGARAVTRGELRVHSAPCPRKPQGVRDSKALGQAGHESCLRKRHWQPPLRRAGATPLGSCTPSSQQGSLGNTACPP